MKKIKAIAAIVTTALFLGGCSSAAGILTTVETVAAAEVQSKSEANSPMEPQKAAIAESAKIKEILNTLTATERSSGSEGEKKAVQYMTEYFNNLGFTVTTQSFHQPGVTTDQNPVSGTNVIAVKSPSKNQESCDILIVSGHLDGKPGIQGALDDASGITVMMTAASLVKDLDTDTEVRFIGFSGEENGRIGSRYYVESLTAEEKARVIGAIQIDELGYMNADYMQLGTIDGKPALLGDMISEQAQKTRNVGRVIPYYKESMSDHNSFVSHGMPAVMLCDDGFAYENHSSQDRTDILDVMKLTQGSQLIADVVARIMDSSTGSLAADAYAMNPAREGYRVQKDTILYFSMDRNFVENMMSLSGTLESSGQNDYGDQVETYTYPLYWFDMDEPLQTTVHYRNGFMENMEIAMQAGTGHSFDEARSLITNALGTPMENTAENGTEYDWGDEVYHKYISLIPQPDNAYQLLVFDLESGKNTRTVYDLSQGWDQLKPEHETDQMLFRMLQTLISPEDMALMELAVYTDGKGNSTGYTSAKTNDDNTKMTYALDYNDMFDEQGAYRNYNKSVRTAVHEYGHVLSLNASQVDLSQQDSSMPPLMFPQETFAQDAYLRAYYQQFWQNQDVKSGIERYHSHPDEFVSEYAAGDICEDFAEAFMLFVLSNKPQDNTIAAQKICFFYNYEELVARRTFIRGNLYLADDHEAAPELPAPKADNFRLELDGNPTTGYTWTYSMEPEGIAEAVVDGVFTQNYTANELVGVGGTYVFEFAGVKAGTATLTFNYARSWESKQPAETRVFEVTVDAAGKVTAAEK